MKKKRVLIYRDLRWGGTERVLDGDLDVENPHDIVARELEGVHVNLEQVYFVDAWLIEREWHCPLEWYHTAQSLAEWDEDYERLT